MNSKRVCVFVDGENFRHTIVNLFEDFDRAAYLPKQADWTVFFDWLVAKVSPDDAERVRTYWYVVGSLDFFPYKLPHPESAGDKLRRLLCKDEALRTASRDLADDALKEWLRQQHDRLCRERAGMQRRFDGWTAVQNGIVGQHSFIEFRRAGAIRYNLFDRSLGPEKAVDVKLATDLITLRDIYDVAVIVSGDQDYVPAVQYVKDCGKSVVNVAFRTRGGKLLPGGAWRLNLTTDWVMEIAYAELRRHMGLDGD